VSRQIALDTETTGIGFDHGHRVIEIGCVEFVDRKLTGNNFHVYINPQRDVPEEAVRIHGITSDFLADKPVFSEVARAFEDYVSGAELIIHNARFDVGFLDAELGLVTPGFPGLDRLCRVTDTLRMAKQKFPGQRASLDALCARLGVDNRHRELHGALLDAQLLADVYLSMTGGQIRLSLEAGDDLRNGGDKQRLRLKEPCKGPVIQPTAEEAAKHRAYLSALGQDEW
jgi:DNA polymerase-3 subunit epsilon